MNKFIQQDLTPDIVKTDNPRIGLIALSTDFTIEQDFRNICHHNPVDIFVNRIPFENPLNHKNKRQRCSNKSSRPCWSQ